MIVKRIEGKDRCCERLMESGLVPGTPIIKTKDVYGNTVIEFRGAKMALRNCEAECIILKED